jgi:hypothetical protein
VCSTTPLGNRVNCNGDVSQLQNNCSEKIVLDLLFFFFLLIKFFSSLKMKPDLHFLYIYIFM